MREAKCWTDHHLVKSVLTMHTIPTHHKKIIRPSFNVSKLTNISRDQQFARHHLGDRLTRHTPMTDSNRKLGPVQNPGEGVSSAHDWTEIERSKSNG
ncbi:hypothetical protein ElyMa_006478200 [Elysia marginata]|uniref:Uncharacterized protein n=1 Tax=Elysia marginata TaxID=1093978 RepID=A0AAV4I2M1_9GAST|nr:hypothetical protein ElyMa_006478200 [Elysia marginata]